MDVNGASIHVDLYYQGPPLLFLHGFTGVGRNWDGFLDSFAPHFQLVVPDLRGHGRSTNPAGDFSFTQSAEDMLALIDALGLGSVRAIGASAGAKTLLHMAVLAPTAIERMVLVSAAPSFPENAKKLMRGTSIELLGPEEWQMMREWHLQGDDQIRMLWRQAGELADIPTGMDLSPAKLQSIQAAALIMHGDRDPFYPVEVAVSMYENIPQSYLWVVPNAGHTPNFLEPPEKFALATLPFLLGEWE